MNTHNKKTIFKYLKANLTPRQFRLILIAPYIIAFIIISIYIIQSLQFESNKPIIEKYDDNQGISYYYDKETNTLFTGKASWKLRFNNQKFEGSYKDAMLHGLSKIWHKNGNLAEEIIYENGVLISRTTWNENGIIIYY